MILIQKLFDYINMNTLANVEEWLIINNLCFPLDEHGFISYIKSQVEVISHRLHPIYNTICAE